MKKEKFNTTKQLETFYFNRLGEIIANLTDHNNSNHQTIFWQEVFENKPVNIFIYY